MLSRRTCGPVPARTKRGILEDGIEESSTNYQTRIFGAHVQTETVISIGNSTMTPDSRHFHYIQSV